MARIRVEEHRCVLSRERPGREGEDELVPFLGQEVMPVKAIPELESFRFVDTWMEMVTGPNRDWIAAFRFEQKDGTVVIAELRLFPREPGKYLIGRWSADDVEMAQRQDLPREVASAARQRLKAAIPAFNASRDKNVTPIQGPATLQHIPVGGITARLLRQIRIRDTVMLKGPWPSFQRVDVNSSDQERETEDPGLKSRRGRPGRSDLFYAEAAAEYIELKSSGSVRPVADLAERRNIKPVSRARDIIANARSRGLLTRGLRGQVAGDLTPRARQLLKKQPKAQAAKTKKVRIASRSQR